MPPDPQQVQVYVRTPLALLALSTALGAALGAATNVSNSVISPFYFRAVMRWWTEPNLSVAAVLQGALEGSVVGFAFGIFLSVVVAIVTRLRCPPAVVLGVLPIAFVIAFACWILGGAAGIGLALLWPEILRQFVPLAPAGGTPLVRFAWVGGSIWGAYGGGLVAMVYSAVEVRRRWRRITASAGAFDVVRPVVTIHPGS